jgi:hypothetical protein
MDEAFVPFSRMLEQMMTFNGEYVDADAGVRSRITACEIESAIELDVVRDSDGSLRIGATPPLYCLRTTVEPSYHRLCFAAELQGERDG